MAASQQEFPLEIDVRAVKSLLDAGGDLLLLDCREPVEYELVRIEGATLIPMSQMASRVEQLRPHRGRRVVVYCHLGGRSLQVTQWLRRQGFSAAQNMSGGIDAWSLEIDPTLPRYE